MSEHLELHTDQVNGHASSPSHDTNSLAPDSKPYDSETLDNPMASSDHDDSEQHPSSTTQPDSHTNGSLAHSFKLDPLSSPPSSPTGPDASEEPPAKKLRTNQPDSSSSMQLTTAQLKFAQNTIKSLKNRREAIAFLKPVDPVALGIPQYPQIVPNPMDLGTVDIKLALTALILKPNSKPGDKAKQASQWNLDPNQDIYKTLQQFESDVKLVFTNCATFNGPDSPYTQSALTLQAAFEKYMKDAPLATAAPSSSAEGEQKIRRPSNPIPTIRRSSDAGGRPKREIHPPPPKDLPWTNEPQSASTSELEKAARRKLSKKGSLTPREEAYYTKAAADELKFCARVVDDLVKPSHQNVAWVFYDIPTMDFDWAPAYFKMIKKPISLRAIQKNIRSGQYADAEDLDADMQTLFKNCFTFNPHGSDVYKMGEDLKKVYEEKMKRKPVPPPLLPDYDDSEEDEEDDVDPEFMERLQDQISGLQATLATLEGAKNQNHALIANTKAMLVTLHETYTTSGSFKKSKSKSNGTGSKRKAESTSNNGNKKKPKAKTAGSPSTTATADYVPSKKSKQASSSSSKKPSAAKKSNGSGKRDAGSDDDIRTVTYEQKEELAAKITELSQERLEGAIRIINEDKPPSHNDEEEIELDIDELSCKTLYKLYKYVVRPTKKAPAAPTKGNGKSTPLDGRKRGTGGVKKKNLDEGEEAERIARLQQQLEQFGNLDAAAAGGGGHDDLVHSDSSSEGGESGSDSDSE